MEAPSRFETNFAARIRRNPWAMALGCTPFGAAIVGGIAAAAGYPLALTIVPHLIIIGVVLLSYLWRKNPWRREETGSLVADSQGVWHRGELILPKDDIQNGLVFPEPNGNTLLRFRRKKKRLPMDIRVADRDQARGILRALGLDAAQSIAKFRLPSRLIADASKRKWVGLAWGGFIALFAAVMSAGARLAPQLAPAFPLFLVLAVVSALAFVIWPQKLEVGADGLFLAWFRSKRFIGYGDIARIDPFEEPGAGKNKFAGLVLYLKSGEAVYLPIVSKQSSFRDEVYILHERIAEAIDTWARGEGVAHAALVRRGERTAAQWLSALRGIGAQSNVDARTAPIMPERLWRIVEDPKAPAEARAGAAVALSHEADESVRARLSNVASAIAAPKLRFAIESAAKNESDAALEAALIEVEADGSAEKVSL